MRELCQKGSVEAVRAVPKSWLTLWIAVCQPQGRALAVV